MGPTDYTATVQVLTSRGGWTSSQGVPTFTVGASSGREACEIAARVVVGTHAAPGTVAFVNVTDGSDTWHARATVGPHGATVTMEGGEAEGGGCEGHASTEGPAGVAVYCDGTCQRVRARR